MATIPHYEKDPDAVLDYKFSWSDWLDVGETISSITTTVESIAGDAAPLIEDSVQSDSSSVVMWLSGGTPQNRYRVSCRITTSNSPARIDERSIQIQIVER